MPMTAAAEFPRLRASDGTASVRGLIAITIFGAAFALGTPAAAHPPVRRRTCARPHRQRVRDPAGEQVPHDRVPTDIAGRGRGENGRPGLRAQVSLRGGLGR